MKKSYNNSDFLKSKYPYNETYSTPFLDKQPNTKMRHPSSKKKIQRTFQKQMVEKYFTNMSKREIPTSNALRMREIVDNSRRLKTL